MESNLDEAELVILAAVMREVMRSDGEISEGESNIAAQVPHRVGHTEDAWETAWNRASRELPGWDAALRAAGTLERQVARELVYELAYGLARDGTIVDAEWDFLEALDAELTGGA